MIWLVNVSGILLIGFIVWWFWLYRPKAPVAAGNDVIEVHVKDGVYDPDRISAQVGQKLRLRFIRQDATPCAEYVVFEAFGLQKQLPLDEPVEFSITPDKAGEFPFTCQMQMYRGILIVKG